MKSNGDYEISDVPRLLERGGPRYPLNLLAARVPLFDAAERIVSAAVTEGRAIKPDEQQNFDDYSAQIRDINGRLAEYKRQRIATTDTASHGLAPVFTF
jgi:hypothetical protein